MNLIQRAYNHNSSAFVAELRTAAAARRLHNDFSGAYEIDRSITSLLTDQAVENDWTTTIAKRFLHDTTH